MTAKFFSGRMSLMAWWPYKIFIWRVHSQRIHVHSVDAVRDHFAGRIIPLNSRIVNVLEMWTSQFPNRQPNDYVFPFERCGAKGEEDSFGFTGEVIFYDTDPTRPIGDWKEAWEGAKERAGAILRGEDQSKQESKAEEFVAVHKTKNCKASEKERKPAALKCRFHDLRHTAVTR